MPRLTRAAIVGMFVFGGACSVSTTRSLDATMIAGRRSAAQASLPTPTLGSVRAQVGIDVLVTASIRRVRGATDCRQFFSDEADATFELDEPTQAISVAALGDQIHALMITMPDGTEECTVADLGRNTLAVPGRRGRYEVRIGSDEPLSAVHAAIFVAPGTTLEIDDELIELSDYIPDPQVSVDVFQTHGFTTGIVEAKSLADECLGYVRQRPNHVLQLAHGYERLVIRTGSDTDTVLVTRDVHGTIRCNDDADALDDGDAEIRGAFDAGRIEVWVGTYEKGARASYLLDVREARGT